MIILWDLMALRKEINGRLQECLRRKQTNSKEAPKMRRVRTHKSSNGNPLAMFAAGVEQIVSDHVSQTTAYDDQELRAMERTSIKQTVPISLFAVLAQQLFWGKTGHQS